MAAIATLLTGVAYGQIGAAGTGDTPTAAGTLAQVESGRTEYVANCLDCHGAHLDDGEFGGPPLKGELFRKKWFGKPLGTLVGFVKTNMPPDSPGRLPYATYAEIAAYLMSANGVATGEKPLPASADQLATVMVPTAAGSPGR